MLELSEWHTESLDMILAGLNPGGALSTSLSRSTTTRDHALLDVKLISSLEDGPKEHGAGIPRNIRSIMRPRLAGQ